MKGAFALVSSVALLRSGALVLAVAMTVAGSLRVVGAQAVQGTGAIAGHVYSADTNQPCRFAGVVVQSVSGGGRDDSGGSSTTTDLDGAFVVAGLSPGPYYVVAQMSGYIATQGVSADQLGNEGGTSSMVLSHLQTVRVEANQQTPAELRLERGAALSGTVRYDDGSPASNLDVRLYEKQGSGVWKAYMNTNGGGSFGPMALTVKTDDRGRFREAGLPAGTYAVDASLPAMSFVSASITGRRTLNLRSQPGQALHVYSGNVFRVRDAVGLELHAGDERADGDLQIPLSGLHSVRGVVDARSTGRSIGQGQVRLLDPADKSVVRETTIGDGGAFAFNYVPSGTYIVRVEARADRHDSQGAQYSPLEQTLMIDGDQLSLAYEVSDAAK